MNASVQNVCPPFWGGMAGGGYSNVSAQTVCPPFWGGNGSGAGASDSSGCGSVLPLRYIKLYGEKEALRNILHWETIDWDGIRLFEIEKNLTGSIFTAIGTVMARVNASRYLFVDKEPESTAIFYRLKIIGNDNSITYSEVIAIRRSLQQAIRFYPNPTAGTATFYYYAFETGEVNLQMIQPDGKEVFSKVVRLKKGINNIPVDCSKIPNGVYFLRVKEINEVMKILIQK